MARHWRLAAALLPQAVLLFRLLVLLGAWPELLLLRLRLAEAIS
jgi:hypothetical protein